MNLKKEYEKYGFVIIKGLLSESEVNHMRSKILMYFRKNPLERMMLPSAAADPCRRAP